MLRNSPDEEEELAGSAASLLPEPEPEKTTEPEESRTEMNVEPRRGGDDPAVINTPVSVQGEQEVWRGEEMPVVINSPPQQITDSTYPSANEEELGLLDGSCASESTMRRSSRVSIPTDRYCAEFK